MKAVVDNSGKIVNPGRHHRDHRESGRAGRQFRRQRVGRGRPRPPSTTVGRHHHSRPRQHHHHRPPRRSAPTPARMATAARSLGRERARQLCRLASRRRAARRAAMAARRNIGQERQRWPRMPKLNASAPNGMAGKWSLDPLNVTITAARWRHAGRRHGHDGGHPVQPRWWHQRGFHYEPGPVPTLATYFRFVLYQCDRRSDNAGLTLEGRHLYATGGSTISISGGALVLDVNTVNTLSNAPSQTGSMMRSA